MPMALGHNAPLRMISPIRFSLNALVHQEFLARKFLDSYAYNIQI